jgi:hypothetical protein
MAYIMKFGMHIVPLKATQMPYFSISEVSNNTLMNLGIYGACVG